MHTLVIRFLATMMLTFYNSEWGYYRDENSGNCVLDPSCGPELDCLTGYVNICKLN